ncbi:hypothetical protein BJAS_P4004 [Bathymodiolus japonicus methanotrophic gill symbiont]|uniref:hypothetical protein n=1 Tax=Bathymodiolus japonicus methanotrophic gill symbiont TaxID=113269 RepID=UPI001B65276E|nr:hypothetical protein [Bathymodiolus japonicus methanotrophic gill symbiont]GFO73287.1 hypothetical protein BJAS_P4004 [Bathymodiolus japonicus methanotrophic gill symbiont]
MTQKYSLEKLLTPLMPSLDDDGREMYSDMISIERYQISKLLHKPSIKIFFLADNESTPAHIESEEDLENIKKRGRTLIIATRDFNHSDFIKTLDDSRTLFNKYLKEKIKEQNLKNENGKRPSSGQRSTAKPTVIDFNANSITYSYTSAYRSSEVSHRDIKDLFEYKIEKLEISLDNSTKNKQYKRIANYEGRLKTLRSQEKEFNLIEEEIIGRVKSGFALNLRAKGTQGAKNFRIKNISIIFSKNPSEASMEPANKHNRPNLYGECLLEIKELNIEIYKI